MSENYQFSEEVQRPELTQDGVAKEYAHSAEASDYGLNARWDVYKYATKPMDYNAICYSKLDCDPTDTLLEVGCSKGASLRSARLHGKRIPRPILPRQRILGASAMAYKVPHQRQVQLIASQPHVGKLIGLDIDDKIFSKSRMDSQQVHAFSDNPIEYVVGKAEQMPIADHAVDHAIAQFMAYHTDPELFMSELQRVVKPGGRVVITTSGPENKIAHRSFETGIAQFLTTNFRNTTAPPIFTKPFDTTVANEMLPKYFNVIEKIEQKCEIRIPPIHEDQGEGVRTYIASLYSMKKHFDPEPSEAEWDLAMRKIVRPAMLQSFKDYGAFYDQVDREIYVCETYELAA